MFVLPVFPFFPFSLRPNNIFHVKNETQDRKEQVIVSKLNRIFNFLLWFFFFCRISRRFHIESWQIEWRWTIRFTNSSCCGCINDVIDIKSVIGTRKSSVSTSRRIICWNSIRRHRHQYRFSVKYETDDVDTINCANSTKRIDRCARIDIINISSHIRFDAQISVVWAQVKNTIGKRIRRERSSEHDSSSFHGKLVCLAR